MKREGADGLRCVALAGKVGLETLCQIYEDRPSTCRKFLASYEQGIHSPICDEARVKHGLEPLRPDDWNATFVE